MTMTINEALALQAAAEETNDGHCPSCHQTIKIYRYNINRAAASFLRAMADEVKNTGVNDVNISKIGLSYSVRTQVAKIRQHGLIARVKNSEGAQLPSRWLITSKGWTFINGNPIPARVVVYNNQVLGHEGAMVTIHSLLDEKFDPKKPIYTESPVSPAEARTFDEVRQPKRKVEAQAIYKARQYPNVFKIGEAYDLTIDRLQVGRPIDLVAHGPNHVDIDIKYRDLAAFQRDWRVL